MGHNPAGPKSVSISVCVTAAFLSHAFSHSFLLSSFQFFFPLFPPSDLYSLLTASVAFSECPFYWTLVLWSLSSWNLAKADARLSFVCVPCFHTVGEPALTLLLFWSCRRGPLLLEFLTSFLCTTYRSSMSSSFKHRAIMVHILHITVETNWRVEGKG